MRLGQTNGCHSESIIDFVKQRQNSPALNPDPAANHTADLRQQVTALQRTVETPLARNHRENADITVVAAKIDRGGR